MLANRAERDSIVVPYPVLNAVAMENVLAFGLPHIRINSKPSYYLLFKAYWTSWLSYFLELLGVGQDGQD